MPNAKQQAQFCNICHRAKNVCYTRPEDRVRTYSELTPSERIGFWRYANEMIGPAIENKCVQSNIRRKERVYSGDYHPKSYFEEKYKDRPDILQKVLENAQQSVHPDTNETLWRETKVSSSESIVHEDIEQLEKKLTDTLLGPDVGRLFEIKVKARRQEDTTYGYYYPKSYFEEKYKDRPDILQKVFENAPRWTHPDTKEDLWRHTKVSCNAITVHEDTAAVDRDGAKVKAKAEEKSMPPDTD